MKSAGPWPRTVSSASRTSSALPTACAERLVHVGEEADDLAASLPAEREHRLREARASSSVFMNAPFPTLTSSTIACAPAASFFDMIEAAIRESWSTVAVTSRSA